MAYDRQPENRLGVITATVAIHALVGAGLVWGLSFAAAEPEPRETLPVLTVSVDPPPPPPPPPPPVEDTARTAPEKPAAPEAPRTEALPVEAPVAAVPLAPRPAAPVAGSGQEATVGAGQTGTGRGAGGSGDGTGGGGDGGGVATPARRIAGALRDSDYPRSARAARLEGTVVIAFRVRTDGRVDRCSVVKSSGYAIFDDMTCRLFVERFRFQPATTASGKPVETFLQTDFTWSTRRMR